MATQTMTGRSAASPAGTGAAVGAVLGFLAGGGSGLLAGAIVGTLEGLLIVSLVTRFGRPALGIVIATLKAVLGSLLGAAAIWWFLTMVLRDIAARS